LPPHLRDAITCVFHELCPAFKNTRNGNEKTSRIVKTAVGSYTALMRIGLDPTRFPMPRGPDPLDGRTTALASKNWYASADVETRINWTLLTAL
jgi:hypothetical protein